MRKWWVCAFLAAWSATAVAEESLLADGRDQLRLRRGKLLNRQLELQLADQPFRKSKLDGPMVAAADTAIGGQIALEDAGQSRFHGYFLADTYLQYQPLEEISVNLNLLMLNPSASDGVRFSSKILPGLALRLGKEFEVGAHTLRIDLLGTDLDMVTIGQGLLVEELPLEGHMAVISWDGFYLREVFGGRVYWDDDDSLALTLGNTDLNISLNWLSWLTDNQRPGIEDPANELPRRQLDYFTLAWSTEGCRTCVQAEAGVLAQEQESRGAGMLRLDRLFESSPGHTRWLAHLGYQARYYAQGFGVRSRLLAPSTAPNTPLREASFATNAFEYQALSSAFHQWSHTAMAEARLWVDDGVSLLAEGELWLRQYANPRGENRVLYYIDSGRLPADRTDVFYRLGFETMPKPGAPHLLRVVVTNKLVDSGFSPVEFRPSRFFTDPVLLIEAEAFL